MDPSEVLHVINLDTIGGVEELFAHFLNDAVKKSPIKHHLLVTGGKIHPHFLETIKKNASSITYEKYFLSLKMPKVLRPLLKKVVFRKNYSHIVLWNRFDDLRRLKKNAQVIYYEHGASWMHAKTDESPSFFQSVDSILANSKAAKHLIELKWKPNVAIAIVENPLRPDLSISQSARTSFHRPFRLGFIGRLIPLKGCSLLLQATKMLLDKGAKIELFIAGTGQEKESLEALAKKLKIDQATSFLGSVQNVAAFYDSIDLLVMPSIREPLGLVALEASARACPVIASYVDGLAEAVQDGKNGVSLTPSLPIERYADFGGELCGMPDVVFDPKEKILKKPEIVNPQDIFEAVEALMNNPETYVELSRKAHDFAKKYPNFSDYTEKLLTFIF
mgnify:CR=1 FL=1